MDYIFTTERLGFRTWQTHDHEKMIAISSDKEVMKHFPAVATRQQTLEFISSMNALYEKKGYCYFAVDRLEDSAFIGFIGLNYVDYKADFTPAVDIGWRLSTQYWNRGYATEGARGCLRYGFDKLLMNEIVAIAPTVNLPSIHVMKKIGMTKVREFEHPRLISSHLNPCVLYRINH